MSRHILSTYYRQGTELDFGDEGVVDSQRAVPSLLSSFRAQPFCNAVAEPSTVGARTSGILGSHPLCSGIPFVAQL